MERIFTVHVDDVLQMVRVALEAGNQTQAITILQALRSADQADIFSELADQEQVKLLPNLAPGDAADILEELHEEETAELAGSLSDEDLARIVNAMEPDEAADLLGDLPEERVERILEGLEDPAEVRPLLLHADESAGGLMTREVLVLRPKMRVQEAIEAIRHMAPSDAAEALNTLYVVGSAGQLMGSVSVYRLLRANADSRIEEVMDRDTSACGPTRTGRWRRRLCSVTTFCRCR